MATQFRDMDKEGLLTRKVYAEVWTKESAGCYAESAGGNHMEVSERYESDVLFFFEGRLGELTVYQELFRCLEAEFSDTSVKVQKSQISFYNRHLYAMVSLPRRKKDSGLLVTFGLARRLASPRVVMAVEPYPGRWTHHVLVSGEEQIDRELLEWIREAYEFAAGKR